MAFNHHAAQAEEDGAVKAARIQAFPDWFVFAPEGGPAPTRNSLSKWIGDAVPPMMGFAAGLSALVGLGMEAGE